MRLRKLTRTSKTSSFLFSFIHSIWLCINLVVFFFLDTSFFLFWTRSFKPGSLKTVSSKIFDDIWRRSWKTSQDIKSFRFLFLGKDWGITRLGLYIRSGFSEWGFLISEKRIDHPTISTLAFFPVFYFQLVAFFFLRLLDSKYKLLDYRIEGKYAEPVVFFIHWPLEVPY